MRYKLGFIQAGDGSLLVMTEISSPSPLVQGEVYLATKFIDENVFLRQLIFADVNASATTNLIASVLLVMQAESFRSDWISVESTEHQYKALGLAMPEPVLSQEETSPDEENLRSVLTQSPTPVTMMVGPEHTFSFINPAYVRLMGRVSAESILGKTVREVLPELNNQPFFTLLDKTYTTGIPYIGSGVKAKLRNEVTQEASDFYFDFVYYPVRDRHGDVCGILCQANDVTERVLAAQVSEAREGQLYRQWAELETIYKTLPVGMSLIDAKSYRILRINDVNARVLGMAVKDVVGKAVFELYPGMDDLLAIYKRVASGEAVRDVQVDIADGADTTAVRHWRLDFTPILDPLGQVESIAQLAIPLAAPGQPDERILFDPSWAADESLKK